MKPSHYVLLSHIFRVLVLMMVETETPQFVDCTVHTVLPEKAEKTKEEEFSYLTFRGMLGSTTKN